jgi:hypothetical protein
MRFLVALLCIILASQFVSVNAWSADAAHRFGIGANYWKTLDDIDVDDVDEDGFSWLASYQYRPGLLGLGLEVEWFEKGFGGASKDVYAPQAYLILGGVLYAAAGIGTYYTDGEWADDPFYAFRVGLDLKLLPSLHLDINANYRFENWDSLNDRNKDIDSDTVTLGAAVRLAW